MIFLSRSFCSGRNTIDATNTYVINVDFVSLQNGIFDEINITSDTSDYNVDDISSEWDFDTIFHALFQGSLFAGNVNYLAGQVSAIRVKRRKKGTYNWTSLFDVPIADADDFEFDRYDFTARGNTEYEYGLFPITDNIEGNPNTNSIKSEFNGVFVMEKDKSFNTELNTSVSTQKQKPTSVVYTYGNKYPYVVSNGLNNSYAGTISGFFAQFKGEECTFDFEQSFIHCADFEEFLKNGRPKLIKLGDGRMWIASIVDDVSTSGTEVITTTFNFVEISNCDSGSALYYNGMIDVNIEGDSDGI